jgi:hypothetical protein
MFLILKYNTNIELSIDCIKLFFYLLIFLRCWLEKWSSYISTIIKNNKSVMYIREIFNSRVIILFFYKISYHTAYFEIILYIIFETVVFLLFVLHLLIYTIYENNVLCFMPSLSFNYGPACCVLDILSVHLYFCLSKLIVLEVNEWNLLKRTNRYFGFGFYLKSHEKRRKIKSCKEI